MAEELGHELLLGEDNGEAAEQGEVSLIRSYGRQAHASWGGALSSLGEDDCAFALGRCRGSSARLGLLVSVLIKW